MPRCVTTYYCSICGADFQTESDALACENAHMVPTGVKSPEYDRSDNKRRYPKSVVVCFPDNKNIRYYRK